MSQMYPFSLSKMRGPCLAVILMIFSAEEDRYNLRQLTQTILFFNSLRPNLFCKSLIIMGGTASTENLMVDKLSNI